MIGTLRNSDYITENDFICSKDYLQYMYGDIQGFITRNTIRNNKKQPFHTGFNRSNNLLKRRYDDIKDVYTSMNTFYTRERKVDSVKRLNALYVDIDCYKMGLSKEAVLYGLNEEFFGQVIPVPTFVIDSGRGIYLIWKISEDRNALPRWTNVQRYMTNACKPFGADPACTDAARILRVPFSINSKSGTPVNIMQFNDVTYTLYEIMQEYDIKSSQLKKKKTDGQKTYPYGEATERMREYAIMLAEQKQLSLPDFKNYQETYQFIANNTYPHHEEPKKAKGNIIYFSTSNIKPMLDGRCHDIERLFAMRKGGNCKREIGLFLYRLWICESTHDYDYALQKTLELNSNMDKPLPENYVIKHTESAEKKVQKGSTYRYGKKRLIEILDIDYDEMNELEYLSISLVSERERKKKSNHRAYLKSLKKEGKETKNEIVKNRRETIQSLISEGKKQKDICRQLNISKATYYRDIAAINKTDIKHKVERVMESVQEVVNSVKKESITGIKSVVSNFQPTNYKSSLKTTASAFSSAPSVLCLLSDFLLDLSDLDDSS